MKVTFDSNTWRKVASPDNFYKDPEIECYKKIRNAINENRIHAFLSETIFTLEAIKKVDRKKFFKSYKASIKTKIHDGNNDGVIRVSLTIGPNEKAHPGNNEFLKEHFADAARLGFKIIHLPRIGGIVNPEISGARYQRPENELKDYLDKVFEVAERINELEAGVFDIQQIGNQYDEVNWFHGIGKAPDTEDTLIAKAVAEWADGDSIACHIANRGDYFCTNDMAKKAGSKSVLSEKNIKILNTEYGIKIINPKELSEKL